MLGKLRIDFLDQMRAIALLPVIIHHYHSPWFPGGALGVGIFFSISGFLISAILLQIRQPVGAEVGKFVIRRFFRVVPLFWFAVFVIWLFGQSAWPEKLNDFHRHLPWLLLILQRPQEWFGYGIGVLWTLQYEMVFYLLSASSVLLFGPRRGVLILCFVSMGIGVLVQAALSLGYADQIASSRFLSWSVHFSCIHFAFGSLLAYLWHADRLSRFAKYNWLFFALSVALLGSLWGVQASPATKYAASAVASFGGALMIAGFLLSSDYPRFFGIPQFIGKISYSAYLVHAILIDYGFGVLGWNIDNPAVFLVLVLSISFVTYSLIEKPGVRLGSWIARRAFPSKAPCHNDVDKKSPEPEGWNRSTCQGSSPGGN